MDPSQTTDFIYLAKAASLSGAACTALLGLFRLIRDLRQPRALAKAVKSLDTRQEQETLVALFRIANAPKATRRSGQSNRGRQ